MRARNEIKIYQLKLRKRVRVYSSNQDGDKCLYTEMILRWRSCCGVSPSEENIYRGQIVRGSDKDSRWVTCSLRPRGRLFCLKKEEDSVKRSAPARSSQSNLTSTQLSKAVIRQRINVMEWNKEESLRYASVQLVHCPFGKFECRD